MCVSVCLPVCLSVQLQTPPRQLGLRDWFFWILVRNIVREVLIYIWKISAEWFLRNWSLPSAKSCCRYAGICYIASFNACDTFFYQSYKMHNITFAALTQWIFVAQKVITYQSVWEFDARCNENNEISISWWYYCQKQPKLTFGKMQCVCIYVCLSTIFS